MKEGKLKSQMLRIIGLLFCIVPPVSATLLYFPVWKERGGGAALSGFTLLLILLSLLPMLNTLKKILRSPAAHTMWFFIFIAFFLLSKIADEMTVISFSGFIGNLIGALLFKAARNLDEGAKSENEE